MERINYIEEAIDIVTEILAVEIATDDAEYRNALLRFLGNVGINPAAIFDERAEHDYLRLIQDPTTPTDFISLLVDVSMELQIRLESMYDGAYQQLVAIIAIAARNVAGSTIYPRANDVHEVTEWEISDKVANGNVDDCMVLRYLVGKAHDQLMASINAELAKAIA